MSPDIGKRVELWILAPLGDCVPEVAGHSWRNGYFQPKFRHIPMSVELVGATDFVAAIADGTYATYAVRPYLAGSVSTA